MKYDEVGKPMQLADVMEVEGGSGDENILSLPSSSSSSSSSCAAAKEGSPSADNEGFDPRFLDMEGMDWYVAIPKNDKEALSIIRSFFPKAKKGLIVEMNASIVSMEDSEYPDLLKQYRVSCVIETYKVSRTENEPRIWLVWIKNNEELLKKIAFHNVLF